MLSGINPLMMGAGGELRPQDVFHTILAPANTMQAAIDGLPFAPDLLIDKDRVSTGDWSWRDSIRGLSSSTVASNSTAIAGTWSGYSGTNNRVAQALKRRAKFADVFTYTGNAVAGRQIPHGLGTAPGLVAARRLDNTAAWYVWHRSIGNSRLLLNGGDASAADNGLFWGNGSSYVAPDAAAFTVSGNANINASGSSFLALAFAHDTEPSGIIQCGTFNVNASGVGAVTLGWRPQFVLLKCTSAIENWIMLDVARGWVTGNDALLQPNVNSAETSSNRGEQSSTGFSVAGLSLNASYVFVAIREPIF